MTARFFAVLLICSAILSGCSQRDQSSEEEAGEKRGERMIQVENCTVDQETLTLDYKVSNPLRYGIYVCEDVDVHGNYDVETRVAPAMLQIKLCFTFDGNITHTTEFFAKYRFLSPGESHSARITLSLPIGDAAPVHLFSFGAKYKQVVLQRAALEIGYIESKYINRDIESVKRTARRVPSSGMIVGMPELRQETIEGKLHKFAIVPRSWPGLAKETSAKVVITDVEIPCSIVEEAD